VLPLFAGCDDTTEVASYPRFPYEGDAFVATPLVWQWPQRWALVTDSFSDTLTLVDRDTLQTVATVPVGLIPLDVDGPHHAALDPLGEALYVPLSYPLLAGAIGPHNGHGESLRDGQLLRLDPLTLRRTQAMAIDPSPGDITVLADRQVVVSHFDLATAQEPGASLQQRRGILTVTNPDLIAAGKPPKRMRSCLLPHGMASSGSTVWISCYGEDSLASVDLSVAKPVVTIHPLAPVVGAPGQPLLGPYSAVRQPGGDLLAVGCRESRDLRLFSMSKAAPVGTGVPLPGAAFFAAWSSDGKTLWAPSQGFDALARIDLASGEVTAQRILGADCVRPHEVQVEATAGGDRIWLVCEGDTLSPGNLLLVDPQTLQTVADIPVGVYPDRLILGGGP
jgi:YVTN family beta-propeller protein